MTGRASGPRGKVKVGELVNAALLENVDYADPGKLERLASSPTATGPGARVRVTRGKVASTNCG